MSRDTRYVRVGAFVLGGLILAVATIVVVAGGRLLAQPVVIETTFDESVQGLEEGSPVKLRGVKLGTVSWIGFVGQVYDSPDRPLPMEERNRVLVRMEIDAGDMSREDREALLRRAAERGLRLRLTPLGITGVSFIQADYLDPERYPAPELHYEPEYVYVPSAPSTITQLSSAAERLMARIDTLDVEGLLTNLDTLLVNVNQIVENADVEGVESRISKLLEELEATSRSIRAVVARAEMDALSREVRGTLSELNATLFALRDVLGRGGDDLDATLENLRVTSQNLREASETARRYPSYLLLGNPPPRAEGER